MSTRELIILFICLRCVVFLTSVSVSCLLGLMYVGAGCIVCGWVCLSLGGCVGLGRGEGERIDAKQT